MTNVNQMVEFLLNENEELNEGFLRASDNIPGRYIDRTIGVFKSAFGTDNFKKQINDDCDKLIDWLKEKDKEYPKLDLKTNALLTWMKTSESFVWYHSFLVNDSLYNSILSDVKKGIPSELDRYTNFNFEGRKQAAKILDNAKDIKSLIDIVNKYKTRSNILIEEFENQKKHAHNAYINILSGVADLTFTCKKIVNLAI